MLNDQDFEDNIIPCIIKLFESPDRSTRLLLLNQIDLYASNYVLLQFTYMRNINFKLSEIK